MNFNLASVILASATLLLSSCSRDQSPAQTTPANPIEGTWQLISGTLIEKGDTSVTDYTKSISMIKVLNGTHFAFLNHDLSHGKDSTASFSAGGGKYTLTGDQYTESLEYCSAREWEGRDFQFTVTVSNDTLIQKGVEKLEDIGIERLNIERYVRLKN
ncbi:hypothetical protein WBG78_17105 [Chryseolinea sp. T2]|uniref:hypothetical protein n=1 Tax=Chryseolinea sp. T2 TaxID=3129255 RepID=UPI00307832CA